MRKNFWSFFISMPATVLIYMPLILLWLEYRQWPLAGFSWWRYGAAFVLLWGGVIFCLWAYFSLMREGEAEVKNFRLNSRKLVTEGPYRFVKSKIVSRHRCHFGGRSSLFRIVVYFYLGIGGD